MLSWSWVLVIVPDSGANGSYIEVRMSYLQESFHLGVKFSTHFSSSPQSVDNVTDRVNQFSPRLQSEMVAVVTSSLQGFFSLSRN